MLIFDTHCLNVCSSSIEQFPLYTSSTTEAILLQFQNNATELSFMFTCTIFISSTQTNWECIVVLAINWRTVNRTQCSDNKIQKHCGNHNCICIHRFHSAINDWNKTTRSQGKQRISFTTAIVVVVVYSIDILYVLQHITTCRLSVRKSRSLDSILRLTYDRENKWYAELAWVTFNGRYSHTQKPPLKLNFP